MLCPSGIGFSRAFGAEIADSGEAGHERRARMRDGPGSAERQRRLRLMLDQCETVRFPFKKRLILANMNLSYDEIPVEQIVSDRLGPALYKLSLAGNRLHAIPEMLIVRLSGLRVLDFSQCDLHSIPDEWDLPSLKKLNLSHNRIKSCLGESVIRGLPELQHLDMYGNKLTKLCCPTDTSLLTKLNRTTLRQSANFTVLTLIAGNMFWNVMRISFTCGAAVASPKLFVTTTGGPSNARALSYGRRCAALIWPPRVNRLTRKLSVGPEGPRPTRKVIRLSFWLSARMCVMPSAAPSSLA